VNIAGTPWCQGAPTYWVTGHQNDNERPRCLWDGAWVLSNTTELYNTADRHACVTMDVNKDGYEDIICNVGAGQGKGEGFNELFMTTAAGPIVQLLSNSSANRLASPSGLQKFPTMRNRVAAVLRNKAGEKAYVFMGTLGVPREDGRPNQHRMFKNVYTAASKFPYFVEVPGPWIRLFAAPCSVSGDFTGDGRDDLVVCNASGPALLVRQGSTVPDSFYQVPIPASNPYVARWHKVRLADVNGDGRKDLVVVTGPTRRGIVEPWYLIVFRGIPATPYFDFGKPYFRKQLPYVPSDVEVLDVNRDGKADIYVVQVNDVRGAWCGPQGRVIQLPKDVVPPLDLAPDVLFVGVGDSRRFVPVPMQHKQPGCGAIAQRWDLRTMLLSQGSFDNSGYMLLLEW
jgi:FG-GAP-like repeat